MFQVAIFISYACLKTNEVSFCEAKTNEVSFCEAKTSSRVSAKLKRVCEFLRGKKKSRLQKAVASVHARKRVLQ